MKKLITLISIAMLLVSTSYAQIPRTLNLQGKVTAADGTPLNGSYEVTFAIYDSDASGAVAIWQETYAGTDEIPIEDGICDVELGAITPLDIDFDEAYYLDVTIAREEDDGTTTDELVLSKQPLSCSAYAMNTNLFNGLEIDDFLRIASNGFVGIGLGTTLPSELFTLHVDGKLGWDDGSGAVDTNLYRSAANTLKTDDNLIVGGWMNTGSHVAVGGNLQVDGKIFGVVNGTPAGAGTTNYLSKWSSPSTVTDSIVYDDGATARINGSLDVFQNLNANAAITGGTLQISNAITAGSLDVTQGLTVLDTLTATADASVGTNLAVGNNLTVGNDATVTGNLQVDGTITGDGLDFDGMIDGQGTTNYISKWTGESSVDDSIIYDTGTKVGIGTTTPAASLDIGGGTATNIDGTDDLLIKGDLEVDGSIYGDIDGVLDGSGTTNYIPRWSSESAVTDSIVYDTGTKVGIGTTTPAAGLDVGGGVANYANSANDLLVGGNLEVDGKIYGDVDGILDGQGTTNHLSKWSSSSEVTDSVIYDNGTHVGIGTISAPELLTLKYDGKLAWSDAAGIADTSLYRASSGVLETNNDLVVGGGLALTNPDYNPGSLLFIDPTGRVTDDGADLFWNSTSNDLTIGNGLEVKGELRTFGPFYGDAIYGTDITLTNDANLGWDDGSNGVDTNLYRSAADTLKTDDNLIVDGTISSGDLISGSVVFAGSSGELIQDNTALFWNDTNNYLGVGTLSPSATLDIGGGVINSPIDGINDLLIAGDLEVDGSIYGNIAGAINGSGDENYLTKWLTNGTIAQSIIYDDGMEIGIGVNTPTELLTIGEGKIGFANGMGSVDTVLYRPAATANTLRTDGDMIIDGGMGIGIGANAPIDDLVVHGRASGSSVYMQNDNSGMTNTDGLMLGLRTDGVNGSLWNYEGGYLRFGSNNMERMRITEGGEVGIGTTSPAKKLTIASTHSGTATDLLQLGTTGYAPNTTTGILWSEGSGLQTKVGGIRIIDEGPQTRMAFDTFGNDDALNIQGGNVGIGTTTPGAPLEVKDTKAAVMLTSTSSLYDARHIVIPYARNGVQNSHIRVKVEADNWHSLIYDIKISAYNEGAGHIPGNAHYTGMVYEYNSVLYGHNQTITNSSGNIGNMTLASIGNNQYTFNFPLSGGGLRHPVVLVELTATGAYKLEPEDIKISID